LSKEGWVTMKMRPENMVQSSKGLNGKKPTQSRTELATACHRRLMNPKEVSPGGAMKFLEIING